MKAGRFSFSTTYSQDLFTNSVSVWRRDEIHSSSCSGNRQECEHGSRQISSFNIISGPIAIKFCNVLTYQRQVSAHSCWVPGLICLKHLSLASDGNRCEFRTTVFQAVLQVCLETLDRPLPGLGHGQWIPSTQNPYVVWPDTEGTNITFPAISPLLPSFSALRVELPDSWSADLDNFQRDSSF